MGATGDVVKARYTFVYVLEVSAGRRFSRPPLFRTTHRDAGLMYIIESS